MSAQSDQDPIGAAWGWWAKVVHDLKTGADRASRARLRRASPSEALSEEATHDLFHRMYGEGRAQMKRLGRVATLACILAHLREDDKQKLGRAAGGTGKGERGLVSHSRIKRLLDAREEDEIATGMRRLIGILGGKAKVRDVVRLVLWIEDSKTRRDFLFDYFNVPDSHEPEDQPAAPATA